MHVIERAFLGGNACSPGTASLMVRFTERERVESVVVERVAAGPSPE